MWQPRRQRNQTEFQHQHEVKTINCLSRLGCHLNKGHRCLCLTKHTKFSENMIQDVCAFTVLLLKVSKNKRSSSSSRRRRWTKRKQQGAEQPKRKAAAKTDWSYPASHHPQQTFINWRRKRKVSWGLHLRRDSSRCKQMKSPERKFQRNHCRTQWRKKKQQKRQWRSASKGQ